MKKLIVLSFVITLFLKSGKVIVKPDNVKIRIDTKHVVYLDGKKSFMWEDLLDFKSDKIDAAIARNEKVSYK